MSTIRSIQISIYAISIYLKILKRVFDNRRNVLLRSEGHTAVEEIDR